MLLTLAGPCSWKHQSHVLENRFLRYAMTTADGFLRQKHATVTKCQTITWKSAAMCSRDVERCTRVGQCLESTTGSLLISSAEDLKSAAFVSLKEWAHHPESVWQVPLHIFSLSCSYLDKDMSTVFLWEQRHTTPQAAHTSCPVISL